jgi:isopropylmalate/homocitrate/citramalate synthase
MSGTEGGDSAADEPDIRLRDVTLREAPQAPGGDYTVAARVEAGRALDDLGLPVVQAGFPAAGEDHATVVEELAGDAGVDTTVSALARARTDDVEAALDAGADHVEVFVPVSDAQLEHVFGDDREAAFDAAAAALLRAREGGAGTGLTLMDAFRAEPSHLAAAFGRFREATAVTLADTVGARTPPFVAGFLRTLAEAGVDLGRAGVHFHDDLGCATANALIAARTGVATVDVSVAGLGERAGNAALEEVVVGTHQDGGESGLERAELVPACRAALDALGESVDERKAVLGRNVSTHESGLHMAAILSDPSSFEPFDPTAFGGDRRLVFGEATGSAAARRLLNEADREPTDELVRALLTALSREGPVGEARARELAATVDADGTIE